MSVLKMAKPPGQCIFCERTGLTKEHVFPDWLNSLYPKRPYNKRERLRAFDPNKQTDQVVLELPGSTKVGLLTGRCVSSVLNVTSDGWLGCRRVPSLF